jgi:hypothetical protein
MLPQVKKLNPIPDDMRPKLIHSVPQDVRQVARNNLVMEEPLMTNKATDAPELLQ